MSSGKVLNVSIMSQDSEVWKGSAKSISLPAIDGRATILPSHADVVYPLCDGVVRIDGSDKFAITGCGFAGIENDSVVVVIGGSVDCRC